jgi:hypothetical protein
VGCLSGRLQVPKTGLGDIHGSYEYNVLFWLPKRGLEAVEWKRWTGVREPKDERCKPNMSWIGEISLLCALFQRTRKSNLLLLTRCPFCQPGGFAEERSGVA